MTIDDLYDEFERRLRGYAMRLQRDTDMADDLVQETFIRALELSFPAYQRKLHFPKVARTSNVSPFQRTPNSIYPTLRRSRMMLLRDPTGSISRPKFTRSPRPSRSKK